MNHQSQSLDFQVLEEFKEKEKIQTEDKSKTSKIKQKNKNNIRNSAVIYKTYTLIFASEYTTMQTALSKPNLKAVYRILRNLKVNKHKFLFLLCTPVIISKMSDDGTLVGLRYFRTKPIRARSKQAIVSAVKCARNNLLLQAEHMFETGSGWVVEHCRSVNFSLLKKPKYKAFFIQMFSYSFFK